MTPMILSIGLGVLPVTGDEPPRRLPDRPSQPVTFAIPIEQCTVDQVLVDRSVRGPKGELGHMTVCLRAAPATVKLRLQKILADLRAAGLKPDALQLDNGGRLITAAAAGGRWEVFLTAAPGDGVMEIVVSRDAP